ncbi:hypothetical protein [Limisphaera sp. VF-2]|jgi:hypothetical protein|uniref:hypothetical protein n=1 Tax=Limisphaera sp. VF-2 TaxID=3400418 RepID=UPI0017575F39|nr:hypothetical protein [Limisphaera sp.]
MQLRLRWWLAGTGALALVWILIWTGYQWAAAQKMTADKLRQWVESTDLARLRGPERERALRQLAEGLNALPYEERRRVRLDGFWTNWFAVMTEDERAAFLDATLPQGLQQMIAAFEELPADRRQRALREAMRRVREAAIESGRVTPAEPPPGWSEDLQRQVTLHGLRAFYSQSSAQTKAELAPVLEELQRLMQSGRFFRGRPDR